MATAERTPPSRLTAPDGPRAKSLGPFDRARAVRTVTLDALAAFEAAILAGDDRRIRRAAGSAMDELVVEARHRALPDELVAEVERWDDGEYRGSYADVELASWALAVVLGSPLRAGAPARDDDDFEDYSADRSG
jgi:hypothetical protein